jgi:hypothetical protein
MWVVLLVNAAILLVIFGWAWWARRSDHATDKEKPSSEQAEKRQWSEEEVYLFADSQFPFDESRVYAIHGDQMTSVEKKSGRVTKVKKPTRIPPQLMEEVKQWAVGGTRAGTPPFVIREAWPLGEYQKRRQDYLARELVLPFLRKLDELQPSKEDLDATWVTDRDVKKGLGLPEK